jgi:hypothetical protein
MRTIYFYLGIIAAIALSIDSSASSNTWTQKASFSSIYRMGAVGFNIGTMGYIGTGDGGVNYQTDIWQYNPSTGVWTQKANFGGGARDGAVGFSIGAKGYIGTGQDINGAFYNDLWEYNPSTNVWIQKANFGGTARYEAVGFSIGAKGYIGTGLDMGGTFYKDLWEYDPSANLWTQKADIPGASRRKAVGFSIGAKGYIGTGQTPQGYLKDFWEYDPTTNTWKQKTNFGGPVRMGAVGFSIGAKGYIGTGVGMYSSYYSDFYEYNPSTDAWTGKADFGGGARYEAVGFSIGANGNIGTGMGTNGLSNNDFWEYTPTDSYRVSIASTDWNTSTTWTPTGIPAATDDVIVQNAVTINGSPLAACNDMTINYGGSVTINSGGALTVNGSLPNSVGTSGLVINDGGSLIYAYGTPMGTIKRLVTVGAHGSVSSSPYGYHFMSSPVTSTTFGNVFGSSGNSIWAQSYGEPTNTWINQHFNNSLTSGTGYSIWVDPSIGTQTAIFSGTFNSDGVSQTLTQSAAGNPGYNGWNLIGNPYTSAIDWNYNSGAWHNSVVDNSVYIWSGSQYLTYNGLSQFGAMDNSDIPAQSGFFVHLTNGTSATITIPWAARVHYSHSLYKEVVPNLLHLGITGNNYRDDTYICFITGATAGFDTQYDAYKLWGISDAPQLYSIIPGANLAGNALPSIESNPEVSIGLKVGAETTYTITADGMESFDLSVPIHLDDLKLGVSTDLRENPSYSFTAAPGDSASRFRVRFNSAAGIDEKKAINIFIYSANEQIVLNNTGNYEGNYYIYGINGQLLVTLQIIPGKEYVSSLPAGMYIIKAVTGSTMITRKVVLL